MNYQSLKELQESVFKRCLELTDKKGNDYSRGNTDVLRIFRESADELGISEYQAIGLFMKKHINAIFHYMKTGGQSESEPIRERVVDAINYLTFLLAAIEDGNMNTVAPSRHETFDDTQIEALNKAIEAMRNRKKENLEENSSDSISKAKDLLWENYYTKKADNANENPFDFNTKYKYEGWGFPRNVKYTLNENKE